MLFLAINLLNYLQNTRKRTASDRYHHTLKTIKIDANPDPRPAKTS
jgi:hypothetical protein